jgi:sugar phosphate isomerase/epimerase
MKYSVFTVCMPEYRLEKVPGLLAKWGYDGVEWRVVDQEDAPKPGFWRGNKATVPESKALAMAAEVTRMTKAAGLEMPGLGTYCGADVKKVPYLMEVAQAMGVRNIRVSTPYYDGTKSYNQMWKQAQKDYARIEKLAAKFKVRSSVEMHPNTLTPSASASLRFLSPFDPKQVGVIYDIGNLPREGLENWRAGIEMLGKYLTYIHMKNGLWFKSAKEPDGTVKWSYKASSLKTGQMDLGKFMEVLVGLGYDGWISLEDFSPGSSKRKLTQDIAYLKGLEARARGAKATACVR